MPLRPVLSIAGAIRSAFAVLSLLVALFGPWGLAIAGVVAGLTLLAAAVDWQGLFNAARAAARVLGSTGHPQHRERELRLAGR
jgi:hypothetical protein